MNRSLWIAASGMETQQLNTDVIANNIANVNTTAYKRGVAHFQDMLYQSLATPGAESSVSELPAGIQLGNGVQTISVAKVFTQGTFSNSSADLDIAIQGEGFLQVTLPDGTTAYTRDGHLQMDSTGQVVNSEGYPILGFPSLDSTATEITITADGTVSNTVNGTSVQKGRIQLVRFPNPEGLKYLGKNLYAETDASGTPQTGNPSENGYGSIAQHYLENSNVEIVKEMVDMIASQRAYEMNSKSIRTADEMLRIAANLR